MALNITVGDILDMEVDAIVISANPSPCAGGKLGKRVYEAAGETAMMEARRGIGTIKKGTSAITPGFNLRSQYVIHTVVPTWYGGYEKEAKYLTRCYWSALALASEKELNSVAFVLLGAGYNRVPVDDACKIAKDAINGWLKERNSKMQVYLVIESKNKVLMEINQPADKGSLSKYHEEELQEYLRTNKGKTRADFDRELFIRYLHKYIPNNRQFARMISYHESNIGRLKNNRIKEPRKEFILSVAIGMIENGFPKERRFDFITAAGRQYPEDGRDRLIEELLDKGIDSCKKINGILYEANPEWALPRKTD